MARKRARRDIGTPGWVTVADLARMEKCHHVTAWRIMRGLQARFGSEEVQIVNRAWRARLETVKQHFEEKRRSPEALDARIEQIAHRLAELERELEEKDARIDALSLELRDRSEPRYLGRSR